MPRMTPEFTEFSNLPAGQERFHGRKVSHMNIVEESIL